ncbi:hypothetical protein B9Z55_015475 [Caenorhabditis nigoni]|uniref:DNA polymerase epsilon subunit n=1 Tax=Caenorhabditis nigoni TaxID=1611254 RepID=A0A2G5UAF6_9PELO|nr:hypothetical protein B9Z55_015475 [Caenorhabditis nigoni]
MDSQPTAEEAALRREIVKMFQIHAFELKKEAVKLCVKLFLEHDKDTRKKWTNKMIELLKKQTLQSSLISEELIRETFRQCKSKGSQDAGKLLNVFDAFSLQPYDFEPELGKMVLRKATPTLAADSSSFSHAARQRFLLVKQRAARCASLKNFKFTTCEILSASTKTLKSVVVLGMLTQQKADCYHIEDLSGSIEVEFKEDTKFHHALFHEHSIAIFEGNFENSVLKVNEVAMVPVESAETTRKELSSNENWFGGEDKIAFRCSERLRSALAKQEDTSIIFLSDVFLDDMKTMRALNKLLMGYKDQPPIAIVLCGNFCSRPRQTDTIDLLDRGFRYLANQLQQMKKEYEKTQFIFVPGPDDPFVDSVLPRPHLPSLLFKHVSPIISATFASNPCRIQFASQEIVVFRNDLIKKMCRHSINSITVESIPSRYARSILSQAHLCPLPQHITPILADFSHCLSLHPLPDLLISADRFETFQEKVVGTETIVSNPGSFARSNYTFHVYYPAQNRIEASQIPNSELID